MALAVEHITLGYGEILFSHQGNLHLILNFLHAHTITNMYARKDVSEVFLSGKRTDRKESLADSILDFLNGERHHRTVSFHDFKF